jgi:carboxymethylenebutenolidase
MFRSARAAAAIGLLFWAIVPFSAFGVADEAATEDPAAQSIDNVTDTAYPQPENVTYLSHGLKLKAYLYKPAGTGPFPAYLWNHGSEQNPSDGRKLAKFWTEHGFVFFAPIRSGHGGNPGPYIGDQQKTLKGTAKSRKQLMIGILKLHERANDDVVAALQSLKKLSFVDAKRIVVAGGSYGGIQTMLTAERDGKQGLGVKCFVAMSPAAMSWGQGGLWGPRLTEAVKTSKAPIFLLQAQNDYNLGPSEVVGPVVDAKGFPSRHKVFPPHLVPGMDPDDHRQGHGKFFGDTSAWQEDVLGYLKDCGVLPKS